MLVRVLSRQFTWDVLVDASIDFEWLPVGTICLYVQIINEMHPLLIFLIETGFTWYLDDIQRRLN